VILGLALAMVVALTALIAATNPVPPNEADPLQREDGWVASESTRSARVARNLYDRGMDSLAKGDSHNAKILFKQALDAQPENVDAMQALGGIHYAELEYEPAARLFERCLEARPEELESYTNLAIVRLCQSDFRRAEIAVLSGLDRFDERERGPFDLILACVSEGQGRHDEEARYLELAKDRLGDGFPGMLDARWARPLHASAELQVMLDPDYIPDTDDSAADVIPPPDEPFEAAD
jgi:tetratricopeptide (TPR) repeat protein